MARSLSDIAEVLTIEQRKRLDDITRAKMNRDGADDLYKKLLYEATEYHGLSWGIIGHHIGTSKESIWRLVQRWKKERRMGGS